MKKFNHNSLYAVTLIVILMAVGAITSRSGKVDFKDKTVTTGTGNDIMTVQFIDVGQGDSELIMLPDGKIMLIDAGDNKHSDNVINALNSVSAEKIDYLIGTHPHADHIGGMRTVVENFDIGNVYMPRSDHDSQTYLNLLEAIAAKDLKITAVKAGLAIIDEPNLKAEFVAPSSDKYKDLNNYSAVLKLTYKNTSFLFCGDAEKLSEDEILSGGYDVSANVLKAGHHGSKTSTSDTFLEAVNPGCVVISCGLNNSYNHPSLETIEKLEDKKIPVLRTDKMGTITLYSDGENIEASTEKQ